MKPRLPAILAATLVLAAAALAFAGDDTTSLSYISYLERYATLRAAHAQETLDAMVNMPVLAGDRLQTARGARVEVTLADGCTLWLDEFTTLDFDAIMRSRDEAATSTSLYLAEGSAALEVPSTAAGEGTVRLDTPTGSFFLSGPGLYRIDIDRGETHVRAFAGIAELPSGAGSALLRGGEEAEVGEGGNIQKATLAKAGDDFWNWVEDRRRPAPSGPTAQPLEAQGVARAAVLDSYGEWVFVPTLSTWMWRPTVSVDWLPYSYGRWYWTPVGWNWISYEPWGWYPYHYGSWYLDASVGWVWGYDPVWAPAWVHWIYTPGYVGWCPRGYYDWWYLHNCTHCWNQWRQPGHWGEVAFDFSGRVSLQPVDPRPWTIVPAGQFGSRHIDRVRVEPGRFFREQPAGREGFIHSGVLVTSPPGRQIGDGVFEAIFRRTGEHDVPGLASVLGRQSDSELRRGATRPLPPLQTGQVVAGTPHVVRDLPDAGARDGSATARDGSVTTRRGWFGASPGSAGHGDSGRTFERGRSGGQGPGAPASVERRIRVDDTGRERVRLADPGASRQGPAAGPPPQPRPHIDSGPASAPPPPPPAPPPPPRDTEQRPAHPRDSVSRLDDRRSRSYATSRREFDASAGPRYVQRNFEGTHRSGSASYASRAAAVYSASRATTAGGSHSGATSGPRSSWDHRRR